MAPAELLNLQAIYYGLRNATQGLWGSDSNDTILVGIVASLDGIVGGISQDHQLDFVAPFWEQLIFLYAGSYHLQSYRTTGRAAVH